MNKPTPPDGTQKDWHRYYAELRLWEYLRRIKPLLDRQEANSA